MEKTKQTFVFDFKDIKFVYIETVRDNDIVAGRLSRLESLTEHLMQEIDSLKLTPKLKGARKVE